MTRAYLQRGSHILGIVGEGTRDPGEVVLVLKKFTMKCRSHNEIPPLLTACSYVEQHCMRKPGTD